jgi:hypothetical protein
MRHTKMVRKHPTIERFGELHGNWALQARARFPISSR